MINELYKEGDNMGLESAYKRETTGLTEVQTAEITAFLNRKKGEAFWALVRQEGQSNKEWAMSANTTPTSLSNIIVKFENFPYKLIEGKNNGRKRCYYLTETAREYVRLYSQIGKEDEQGTTIYQQEEWLLRQRFKEALESLKERHGEEWEVAIDDILVRRILCSEDAGEPEDMELVDEIIFVIETVSENEYEESLESCMRMLSPSVILSNRIDEYLKCFYAFTPFYEKFQQGKDRNAVDRIFRMMIFNGETSQYEQEIQRLGLEKEQVEQLELSIRQIKKYCHEQNEELICGKLQKLMPVRDSLNSFLASWICHFNEQSK